MREAVVMDEVVLPPGCFCRLPSIRVCNSARWGAGSEMRISVFSILSTSHLSAAGVVNSDYTASYIAAAYYTVKPGRSGFIVRHEKSSGAIRLEGAPGYSLIPYRTTSSGRMFLGMHRARIPASGDGGRDLSFQPIGVIRSLRKACAQSFDSTKDDPRLQRSCRLQFFFPSGESQWGFDVREGKSARYRVLRLKCQNAGIMYYYLYFSIMQIDITTQTLECSNMPPESYKI